MSTSAEAASSSPTGARRGRKRTLMRVIGIGLLAYFVIAYALAPLVWRRYEKWHPALDGAPQITHTGNGIPGDPLNIGLIATEGEVHRALLAARWSPADPITLESSIRIAGSTVFHRPYEDAPVSSLFLWGRRQDLAFEQPIGEDARRRHHVRFWHSEQRDDSGRPLWLGAVTFDTRVGFSHTTGEITHHISADVDAERDKLLADLQQAAVLAKVDWVDGFHDTLAGKNGGGDPWHTDGRLAIGVLRAPQGPE